MSSPISMNVVQCKQITLRRQLRGVDRGRRSSARALSTPTSFHVLPSCRIGLASDDNAVNSVLERDQQRHVTSNDLRQRISVALLICAFTALSASKSDGISSRIDYSVDREHRQQSAAQCC